MVKKIIKRLLSKHRERLPVSFQRKYFKCVTVKPNKKEVVKGRVLLSYAIASAGLPDSHPMFDYHTGPWESNKVISIFNKYGYIVDCIHFTNRSFVPEKTYDIIFACTGELYRLVAYAPGDPNKITKIWHSVISSIDHNNEAEMVRIDALEKRRPGALYFPKRQEPHERLQEKLMKLVDYCVLIGNDHVQSTFPKWFYPKITRVTVTASPLRYIKKQGDYVPKEREFIWYFGSGAVRKGLDLLLEIFSKHPEWTLNIIGLVEKEIDFVKIYKRELTETKNIKLHGYLNPSSDEFIKIAKRSFCFLSPSATESISTAAATMMQLGLYPLVSYDTGLDLPAQAGMYLKNCTLKEIEDKIAHIYIMEEKDLAAQIKETQSRALKDYSREKFVHDMESFIRKILEESGRL